MSQNRLMHEASADKDNDDRDIPTLTRLRTSTISNDMFVSTYRYMSITLLAQCAGQSTMPPRIYVNCRPVVLHGAKELVYCLNV